MILQALTSYYERLLADAGSGVPPAGYCSQGVRASIVLDRKGGIVQIRDLGIPSKGKPKPQLLVIPARPRGRTSTATRPGFLADETGYVLGADAKGKPKRALAKFEAFRNLHHRILRDVDDPGARALVRFLSDWDPGKASSLERWDEWVGTVIVFEYENEGYLHERSPLRKAWERVHTPEIVSQGFCLVTGAEGPIARLHLPIKGVRNAQFSGAALVSFNFDAACSYGKEQNFNAPVSEPVAFAYTTALNHLLKQRRQRVQVGDATTVFWTAAPSRAEEFMGRVFTSSDDAADVARLREWLEAARSGHYPRDLDPDMPFFILGLAAPAKGRLSVRFWYAGTVGDIGTRIERHFEALSLERLYGTEPQYPGLRQLLLETAVRHEPEEIPETLADAVMRAVLAGMRYPDRLLPTLLDRARTEQAEKDRRTGKPVPHLSYLRAALIKACLMRNYNKGKEATMSLNVTCREPGYLLGRLFAALERTQEYANPGINTTIRDRYYGSASVTPASVFPILIRLNQHHLSKVSGDKAGLAVNMEKLNGEIMDGMPERFPARLGLEEQGMFALGYYHQRNALFGGKKTKAKGGSER
jgi:CRISPR-associated protein Csd1